MVQPDGRASLDVRERYLRRRRARRGADRMMVALWILFGALVAWVSIVGLAAVGR